MKRRAILLSTTAIVEIDFGGGTSMIRLWPSLIDTMGHGVRYQLA